MHSAKVQRFFGFKTLNSEKTLHLRKINSLSFVSDMKIPLRSAACTQGRRMAGARLFFIFCTTSEFFSTFASRKNHIEMSHSVDNFFRKNDAKHLEMPVILLNTPLDFPHALY